MDESNQGKQPVLATIDFTGTLSTVLIFLFGVWMMKRGYTTLGTVIAFSNYMGMFWQPINNISNFYNQLLVAMYQQREYLKYLISNQMLKIALMLMICPN